MKVFIIWISFLATMLLTIIGLGVIVLKEDIIVAIVLSIPVSIFFSFSTFVITKHAKDWDITSGEIKGLI